MNSPYNPGTTNTKCIKCHHKQVTEGTLCNNCENDINQILNNNTDWNDLQKRLDKFDRTYEMSDSHGVWARWHKEEKELTKELQRALDDNRNRTILLIHRFNNAERYGAKINNNGEFYKVYK